MNATKEHITVHQAKDARIPLDHSNVLVSYATFMQQIDN